MKCFDLTCKQPALYDIRELEMCASHYIEALEHSAHLVSLVTGDDHPILVGMPIPRKGLDNSPIL